MSVEGSVADLPRCLPSHHSQCRAFPLPSCRYLFFFFFSLSHVRRALSSVLISWGGLWPIRDVLDATPALSDGGGMMEAQR